MAARTARGPTAWVTAMALVAASLAVSTFAADGPGDGASGDVHVASAALRRCDGEPAKSVSLPDSASRASGDARPLRCSYRLSIPWEMRHAGIYIPTLRANATISVNTVEVSKSVRDAARPMPRSVDRIALVDVPDPIWHAEANVIDIDATGLDTIVLSKVSVGAIERLRQAQRLRVLGVFIGPCLVAAVVGTLGLCMLLLWARQREGLYGYFGAGTLCWGLHTLWTVSPWQLLPSPHQTVWWTSAYTFFVAMLIIFCVRFSGWNWPRFERVMKMVPLAAIAALYAAAALDELALGEEVVRLVLLAMVGTGVVAVVRAAIRRPSVDLSFVIASGIASFGFGLHDWLAAFRNDDDAIVLVPYAGLVFATFVVRMLIDRFARTTEQLALMNGELELRVARQTTELVDAIEHMRKARDAAEASDLAKTRFLAAASHDLRQPAHALTLYMATLRCGALDSRQAELVERMSGSLSALESMFNMLLDLSRMDAGALKPEATTFSIDAMLRGLAEEFAPQAEAQGLRLALRLPSPTSTGVLAHSDRLLVERAVRNLLANAVKYTSQGGVLLACRLRGAAPAEAGARPARPRWRIEVWDTGLGISDADKSRVFEEFFQVSNPGRDRAKGLGLGLSIVQRIVGLLGLELAMGSRRGHGSCFALSLPQADGDALACTGAAPLALTVGLVGVKVAMIEDDMEVRDAMCGLLERWGCAVVAGADADELHARLADSGWRAPPEALLIDQRLGAGRTGPDEARRLFSHLGRDIPTLVVTGESDLAAITAAGHPYLTKPVSPLLLRNWLAAVRSPPVPAATPETARLSGAMS